MYQDHNGYDTNGEDTRQERVSRLLDAMSPPQLYTVRVEQGRVIDVAVGGGICDLLGYPCDELESDHELWADIIHPDDLDRVLTAFGSLMSGEPIFELYRVFRRDGQMRWVRNVAAPSVDADGEVRRIVGIMASAGVPELVPERMPQYKILLEDIPIAIMIRDVEGKVLYSNKAGAEAYGYASGDEMIGTTFADILSPESYREFMADVLPRILRGSWSGDVKLKRRDGSIFYARVAATVLRDNEGNPAAIYAVLFDITEHFKNDSRLSGQCLDAEVSDRDVVLVGCVDSEELERVAEEVALGVPGVRHVASQIEVKSTD